MKKEKHTTGLQDKKAEAENDKEKALKKKGTLTKPPHLWIRKKEREERKPKDSNKDKKFMYCKHP